jgi:GNAT superfamily N-acetyltransferase
MSLTWRAFTNPDDTDDLISLVRRMSPWNEQGIGWLHPGDVVWRLYQNLAKTPEDEVRIVADASGTPLAMVELLEPETFCIHMPSRVANPEGVIRFATHRAEETLRTLAAVSGNEPPLAFETEVLSLQPCAAEILQTLGYGPAHETHYRLNGQPVGDVVPALVVPDGVVVRAVQDTPADFQKRVDLHRDVWTGSKLTLPGYERLRTKPLYREDLDLVVATAEGDLAAYCIVWWDPETRTGEFEPVGTAERFRRRGFGKAVLLEGLRRLHELGAEYAIVISGMGPEAEPARRLYGSAGFAPIFTFDVWKKPF